jgi:hypothetical protein
MVHYTTIPPTVEKYLGGTELPITQVLDDSVRLQWIWNEVPLAELRKVGVS